MEQVIIIVMIIILIYIKIIIIIIIIISYAPSVSTNKMGACGLERSSVRTNGSIVDGTISVTGEK